MFYAHGRGIYFIACEGALIKEGASSLGEAMPEVSANKALRPGAREKIPGTCGAKLLEKRGAKCGMGW